MINYSKVTKEDLELHCKFEGFISLSVLEKMISTVFSNYDADLELVRGDDFDRNYLLLTVSNTDETMKYRLDFNKDDETSSLSYDGCLMQLTNLGLSGEKSSYTLTYRLDEAKSNFYPIKIRNASGTKLVIEQIAEDVRINCYSGNKTHCRHYEVYIHDIDCEKKQDLFDNAVNILDAVSPIYDSRKIDLIAFFKQVVLVLGNYQNKMEFATYLLQETDFNRTRTYHHESLVTENSTLLSISGLFPLNRELKRYSFDINSGEFFVGYERIKPNFAQLELPSSSNSNIKWPFPLLRYISDTKNLIEQIYLASDNNDSLYKRRTFPLDTN